MRWEVISNPRSVLKEYRLVDNNDCHVILKYNPEQQSIRVVSGNHQRLFFVEKAGSLSGKTIFKNEYGMELGAVQHHKLLGSDGHIHLDGKKYTYKLQNTPLAKLFVYNDHAHTPIITCGLQAGDTGVTHSIGITTSDIDCYLLGVCWFLFLPIAKENIVEFAA